MQLLLITEGDSLYKRYLEFRYNVFNVELQRIQSKVLEDKYDDFSLHFVLVDNFDNIVGCARVINAFYTTLNIEERYIITEDFNRNTTAEISRLALAKPYRNSITIKYLLDQLLLQLTPLQFKKYLLAVEPSFARLMQRQKINIKEAGPLNENVVPARQPYVITK